MESDLDLIEDGVVIHKAAVPPADVQLVKLAADKAYAAVEAVGIGIEPEGSCADLIKHIASTIDWGGMHVSQALDIAQSSCPDAGAAFDRIVERVEQILADSRRRSGAKYREDLSYLRRHRSRWAGRRGRLTPVPWHFDAGAAGTAEWDPCFNVWMPLVPVGTICPTLEFLPRSSFHVRSGRFTTTPDVGFPDEAWVSSILSDDLRLAPILRPGDIAIFDHWTLHRTQPLAWALRTRTSAEIRFSDQPFQPS